ncbi:MAG: hypothetical protein AOA65_2038 [Candidatus Bathyarchaeota archaeon BA1]|nr:MAG: hypothetical protein AOA65_2038 [Candidatus Bathyarchaeota archaeon BA1]
MLIIFSPHATVRMRDRVIIEMQVREVLQSPVEVIPVKYGRFAAYRKLEERELLVVFEKKNEEIEVITVLWVDERRLRRLGFTGV